MGFGKMRWWGSYILPSAIVLTCIVSAAWILRDRLHELLRVEPGLLPALVVSLTIWTGLGGLILIIHANMNANDLRARIMAATGLKALEKSSRIGRWWVALPDPLEWLLNPILRTSWGQQRTKEWQLAGFGNKGSRCLMVLALFVSIGGFAGYFLAGRLLAAAFGLLLPLLPFRLIQSRAKVHSNLLREQVPSALGSMAAGLSAGLSLPQAVEFAMQELPTPIAASLAAVHWKIELGHPTDEVLRGWPEGQEFESLSLAVDGILLQRRMGGNLVSILRNTASLARERSELEREVKAVTAQGRLSGWVIGALVPISAGLLLATNPRYIDILFNTIIGQALLVVALGLQLIGWLVISRLIRVRY
jgi:tight adherence protein B